MFLMYVFKVPLLPVAFLHQQVVCHHSPLIWAKVPMGWGHLFTFLHLMLAQENRSFTYHPNTLLVYHYGGKKVFTTSVLQLHGLPIRLTDHKSVLRRKQCSGLNRIVHSLLWETGQLWGPAWSHDVFLYQDAPQRMWKAHGQNKYT